MAKASGWRRRFEDPITTEDAGELATLQDAARYIQKLSKGKQRLDHWQTAVAVLIDAAEGRDFLMHARVAMLRAIHHGRAKPADAEPRRKRARTYKIIR